MRALPSQAFYGGACMAHTMVGTYGGMGLHRPVRASALACLRRSIKEERPPEMRYEITAGILELYNEAVFDLLAPAGKAELELAKAPGGFDLPELTRIGVPWSSIGFRGRAEADRARAPES